MSNDVRVAGRPCCQSGSISVRHRQPPTHRRNDREFQLSPAWIYDRRHTFGCDERSRTNCAIHRVEYCHCFKMIAVRGWTARSCSLSPRSTRYSEIVRLFKRSPAKKRSISCTANREFLSDRSLSFVRAPSSPCGPSTRQPDFLAGSRSRRRLLARLQRVKRLRLG